MYAPRLTVSSGGEETRAARVPSGWTARAAEVAVFLFLILPSLGLSLFVKSGGGGVSFELEAVATILRDLSLVCLILFFLWRNGEPLQGIGWTRRRAWLEIALGVVLFVPFFFAVAWLGLVLQRLGLSSPPLPTSLKVRGEAESFLGFVLVVVVAVSEETIFRGYLLLRLTQVLRSPVAAVFLSTLIFSLGHGYEGSAGLITVGVMGAVFALVYLWRRSLVAPVVMHFLQDFLVLVLLPLLTLR